MKNNILFLILFIGIIILSISAYYVTKENYNSINYKKIGDFPCDCNNKLNKEHNYNIIIDSENGENGQDSDNDYNHHYDRYKRRYNFLGAQNRE